METNKRTEITNIHYSVAWSDYYFVYYDISGRLKCYVTPTISTIVGRLLNKRKLYNIIDDNEFVQKLKSRDTSNELKITCDK